MDASTRISNSRHTEEENVTWEMSVALLVGKWRGKKYYYNWIEHLWKTLSGDNVYLKIKI